MDLFRGWIGEKITTFRIWLSLNAKTYVRFHNLIIPGKNGTTQIDHLLVSRYGLFIIETKNKKGWIFGSANQPKWTQVIYGKKYSFQNPLRQTFRQKKILCEFLDLDETMVHTIVYFVGNCKFKTQLPDNINTTGLGRYIKQFQNQIISIEDVHRVSKAIEKHLSESPLSKRDHIKSLRKRQSSNTICPRCGSTLKKRIVKQGSNAGAEFLGCENYPKCRFTKNI